MGSSLPLLPVLTLKKSMAVECSLAQGVEELSWRHVSLEMPGMLRVRKSSAEYAPNVHLIEFIRWRSFWGECWGIGDWHR